MDGTIALEGAFLIERAAAVGLDFEALYCVPAREAWARSLPGLAIEPKALPEGKIAEIAGYAFHRGAYALARKPAGRSLDEVLPAPVGAGAGEAGRSSAILVLPETADPENLGAAFRNAAALGCSAVLLGPTGPDPFGRRVLRVSMGAVLSLPWARLTGPGDLDGLHARGFETAACVLAPDATDIRRWEAPERIAFVLGHEAFGLSEAWLAPCSVRLTLPMQGGADSLNVATAAAVILYAAVLGRRHPGAHSV